MENIAKRYPYEAHDAGMPIRHVDPAQDSDTLFDGRRDNQHQAYSDIWHRSPGPKYAPHDMNSPIFEGKDIAGLVAAVVITLGPLAAFSLGMMG